LVKELSTLHAGQGDFTESTAAAKINGYLGGNGNLDQLAQQLKDIGLSAEAINRIVAVLRGAGR
jgi:peptide-methionine (S)-S-oxide reductase